MFIFYSKAHGMAEIADALFPWMDLNQISQNIWNLSLWKKINNKGISQI